MEALVVSPGAVIDTAAPVMVATAPSPGDKGDGAVLVLPVGDIHPYDRNPRTAPNPKYAEIKASIRERGFKGHLTVTCRPADPGRYLLYMGGSTRLQIVKELHAETGDPRFAQVGCVYHAWISEADVLASFLIENEARGDTLFLEKARGLVDLAREIEHETGQTMTARDLQAETAKMGMTVNQSTVLLYQFAVTRLQPLGPWLTRENVGVIKRRYAQHEALALSLRLAGRFSSQLPDRMMLFLTGFARDLEARRQALPELGERATHVALRGETLAELLRGFDRVVAEALELDADAARRMSKVLDAAGKERANLSPESLRVAGGGDERPDRETVAPTPARAGGNKVKGDDAADSGRQPALAHAPAPIATDEVLSADRFNAFGRRFFSRLQAWCDLTRIGQWLENGASLDLPFLFWLDLPEETARPSEHGLRFEDVGDPEFGTLSADSARIRASSYRLIAMLSGQLGGETGRDGAASAFAERLPAESTWRTAVAGGAPLEDFRKLWTNRMGGLVCRKTGRLGLAPHDLPSVLQAPALAERWSELTTAYGLWAQALARWRTQRAGAVLNNATTYD
jgi:ParB family protein of integrating conjugative element (PFGI_1 class)